MHLLILSCNTGEGHNSAAKAIGDFFTDKGETCDIQDALAFWGPEMSKIISMGHVFIYRRLPKLFGVGYRFEENHPAKDGDESFMYFLVTKGCETLLSYLQEHRFDAVVCTHIFSTMMMTELRRSYGVTVPTYFVSTDYSCCPGLSECLADRYFIPHADLIAEFTAAGIPKEKIVPSGIPVNPRFTKHVSPEEAKRRLHLPVDEKIVLLMCGSMGCGPIKKLTAQLPERLPNGVRLVAICGSNRHLARTLSRAEHGENLTVVGYTTRMSLYMDAATLYLTKPGGLSSTEAVTKRLPLVLIHAVPGCETRNLDFFRERGLADTRADVDELIDLVCNLCADEKKLARISKNMEVFLPIPATETIYQYILEDVTRENC